VSPSIEEEEEEEEESSSPSLRRLPLARSHVRRNDASYIEESSW
jgi:hypothetical protein